MSPTDFPRKGAAKAVSLRNSDFARFDVAFALALRAQQPELWTLGSATDAHFEILARVARQGGAPHTRAEDKAVRLREAWAAQHYQDHSIEGVIAQIQWLVVGEQGETAMKKTVEEQKDSHGQPTQAASGGREARDGNQRTLGRAGNEGESPLYVQLAVVRAVRRESRPDRATGQAREVVVVDFVASTEIKDSHDSIVRSNWDLTRFSANPVLLWMHGRMNDLPAVGNVENLRRSGTTHEGVAVFDDTTQFDRDVARKYEKSVLKGFSIGFYPRSVRFERVDDEEILILDDIEILEISCVNVPSNPEALAKSRGWERAIAEMSADVRSYEALRQRALAALPARATPTPKPHGETMKTVKIEERDIRAKKNGVQCEAMCPNCNEKMIVDMEHSPMPEEKALELQAAVTRAGAAETRATELHLQLTASQARAVEFEKQVGEMRTLLIATRVNGAKNDLTARSGEKILPAEFNAELELAQMYLADLTPDPDPKAEGRTVGEMKWAKRLALIDGRPSHRTLMPPVSAGTNGQKPGEPDATVRSAVPGEPATTNIDLAARGVAELLAGAKPAPGAQA